MAHRQLEKAAHFQKVSLGEKQQRLRAVIDSHNAESALHQFRESLASILRTMHTIPTGALQDEAELIAAHKVSRAPAAPAHASGW